MRTVSQTYKDIIAGAYWVETKVNINGTDYGSNTLISVNSDLGVFPSSTPAVGGCVSGRLYINMIDPKAGFPKRASVKPYVRLKNAAGDVSEWLQKGEYFIDRAVTDNTGVLSITAFDVILKMEQPMHTDPQAASYYPKSDFAVAQEVATRLNTTVDPRTVALMVNNYQVQYPGQGQTGYTMRNVMGYVAAMYGSNWVSNDLGQLMLVPFISGRGDVLIDENDNQLVFAEDIYISVDDME